MSTILNDELFAKVKNNMDNNKSKAFVQYVTKYIDRNTEVLNHNVPSKRLFFFPDDLNFPFKLLGITLEEIDIMVKKIKKEKDAFGILNKVNFPTNFLLVCMIKYFDQERDANGLQAALIYLTCYQYASSLHKKYYTYLPNENCMQFTFNRISDKYFFRKYQTVFKALIATTLKNHDSMKKDLLSKNDMDLLSYILSLRNRLNNQMKTFSSEYYHDFNNKNYLNLQADNSDPDNYIETTNASNEILNILNNVYNSFNSNTVDPKILRISCNITGVNQGVMKTAIENMKDNETNSIRILILSILQLYMSANKNNIKEIGSQKFFAFMISVYSKSNSKNEITLNIKESLDKFLEKYSTKYSNTDREATKGLYRKALYIYMVLLINDKH